MRTFEKAFTLPFQEDWGRFTDKNDEFGFQLADYGFPDEKIEKLLRIINGEIEPDVDKVWTHEEGYIVCEGVKVLLIRGWGYLTGIGGLNLPPEKAAVIQDDLADYICTRLNGNK